MIVVPALVRPLTWSYCAQEQLGYEIDLDFESNKDTLELLQARKGSLIAMLAFKMKRPQQEMGIEQQLASKVDTDKWGPWGSELITKIDGFRKKMQEASIAYSEKGAQECREVFGRYQLLVHHGGIVCQGIDMKERQLGFKWADAFDSEDTTVEFDWTFERTCVIFNLAGSISYLATHCDRVRPCASGA